VAGVGVSWPQALRRVRAWLAPWVWLQRCWRGWSASPPVGCRNPDVASELPVR
jgi:hypothetical protein